MSTIHFIILDGRVVAAADPDLLDEVIEATDADECVGCGELTTRLEEGATCYPLCAACHEQAVLEAEGEP